MRRRFHRAVLFFFSSRRRHTRYIGDWSSDVCSSDLAGADVKARERKVGQLRDGLVLVGDRDIDRFVVGVRVVGIVLRVVIAVPGDAADQAGGVFFLVAVRLGRASVDAHVLEQNDVLGVW